MSQDPSPWTSPVTSAIVRPSLPTSFHVDGMDLTQYMPTFNLLTQHERSEGGMRYHLRSDSCKTLWMLSLYPAVETFMAYLGYEPTEIFEYTEINPCRKKKSETLFTSKLLHRLQMKQQFQYINGFRRRYVYIVARFMDNDPDLNYGFSCVFNARNVDLITYGHHALQLGNVKFTPAEFIHQLLLVMKYPRYMYETQKRKRTIRRFVRNYEDCVQKRKGTIYEPWGFVVDAIHPPEETEEPHQ